MTVAGAGVSAAGPMWHEFMVKALANTPIESFPEPYPVSANKAPLDGSYTSPDGQIHTILYNVDRSDPLGPAPISPGNDPQFYNWEWVIRGVFGPLPTPLPDN